MDSQDLKNIFSGYTNWAKEKFGLLSSSQLAEAQRRFKICSTCPNNISDKCSLCGCFIKVKVFSPNSECPDNPKKW